MKHRNLILGVSAFYHDSAAALVEDGKIIAAAQEERFTRKRRDDAMPSKAIEYLIQEAKCRPDEVRTVAFYDKPLLKFERILETYHAFAPSGLVSFAKSMPVWIKEKLMMKSRVKDGLSELGINPEAILFPEHHLSHASSAFFPSPFADAAILTMDGVGEWATTTICGGNENGITLHRQLDFPHSLGLLYSAFTQYCGFKVNSGEYKLMGLAPYGLHGSKRVEEFKEKILDQLIDLRPDGSFLMNMEYFDYATKLSMCNIPKWEKLLGIPPRQSESNLTEPYMDLALAIQEVTETIVLLLAQTAKNLTKSQNLVLAGGVALNCVANGKLLRSKIFEKIWIQPASGDAGGALGAALAAHYIVQGGKRVPDSNRDSMLGSYLGPAFTNTEAALSAEKRGFVYKKYDTIEPLCRDVAKRISEGAVVGWFQGRMEYGPRALGNRSIIADARSPEMQKKLNLKTKYREGFRPFAPSVLAEDCSEYFDIDSDSPYMLLVADVRKKHCIDYPPGYHERPLSDRLYFVRSSIPAVTHIDYSARIQTVEREVNSRHWALLNAFKNETGCSVLVNTSFNVRGEPIVCTPDDALTCFMRTEMDVLVVGDLVFIKSEQTVSEADSKEWMREYALD